MTVVVFCDILTLKSYKKQYFARFVIFPEIIGMETLYMPERKNIDTNGKI